MDIWEEGRFLITKTSDPGLLLHLARLGTLVFFAWGCFATWLLAQRIFNRAIAGVAIALFTTLPTILGNAEVAATDLAQAATFGTLIHAYILYLEAPSNRSALLFGAMLALALVAKFTTIPLFLACALGLLGWRWFVRERGERWLPLASQLPLHGLYAVVSLALVILIIYRGRFGSLIFHDQVSGLPSPDTSRHGPLYQLASLPIYPAFEFWRGLLDGFRRNGPVHSVWLWGAERHDGGVWAFPVELLVKTPLSFLALACLGSIISLFDSVRDRDWAKAVPAIASYSILCCGMAYLQPLGIRYLLSVYIFLAIAASVGVAWLWRQKLLGQGAVVAACLSTVLVLFEGQSDYLSWFNIVAAEDPSYYEATSDLDWGQYGVFVAEEFNRRGVGNAKLMLGWYPDLKDLHHGAYQAFEDLTRIGMPPFTPLPPDTVSTGWIAIDAVSMRLPAYQWLTRYTPVTNINHYIYLYHIN